MVNTVLAPIIEELVFECEEQVRISSLAANTTVVVQDASTGAELGRAVSMAGSVLVTTTPLTANNTIVAVAELNGASARSATVDVRPLPTGLAPVLHLPIYVGGLCVALSSRMPRGATIETLSGSTSLGRSAYFHPSFRQSLQRSLESSDDIHVTSDICSHQASSAPAAPDRPVGARPYDEQLPPLTLQQPLACQRSVAVSGIIHGATVIVEVNNTPVVDTCPPWNGVSFGLPQPLAPGDSVVVSLRMRGIQDSAKTEPGRGNAAAGRAADPAGVCGRTESGP